MQLAATRGDPEGKICFQLLPSARRMKQAQDHLSEAQMHKNLRVANGHVCPLVGVSTPPQAQNRHTTPSSHGSLGGRGAWGLGGYLPRTKSIGAKRQSRNSRPKSGRQSTISQSSELDSCVPFLSGTLVVQRASHALGKMTADRMMMHELSIHHDSGSDPIGGIIPSTCSFC